MSILNSAINSIEVSCDQVLSDLIIIGSGTIQFKNNLQFLKNSLLPDLREFETILQRQVALIKSSLYIIETNLETNSDVTYEMLKIRNNFQELMQQASLIEKELANYRNELNQTSQKIETIDKKDLLNQQETNSSNLKQLQQEKNRIRTEIDRLNIMMVHMIADPLFAEIFRGQIAALIFSENSIINQIAQNLNKEKELTYKCQEIEKSLNVCNSLINSIVQISNNIQGTKNELSAMQGIIANLEVYLNFSDTSVALMYIAFIRLGLEQLISRNNTKNIAAIAQILNYLSLDSVLSVNFFREKVDRF